MLGTAQYLSPEQAQGLEVTATSDLYSIGVILYEALTGQVPFQAETAVAIALKQVSEQPRRPSELNPKVSPALDAVVLKALAKEPENRFQSANEFLRALDAAETTRPARALGGTAAYAAAARRRRPAPAEDDADSGRRRKLIALAVVAALIAAVVVFALTRSEQVTVPDRDRRDAGGRDADPRGRGLRGACPRAFESCDEPQTVAEQDPPAGSEADEGSTVEISVSLGLQRRGARRGGQAAGRRDRDRLQDEQLQVEERRTSSRRTSPRAASSAPIRRPASEVECESVVTLFVSKGQNLAPVPDVLGQTRVVGRGGAAERRLRPERRDRELGRARGHRDRPGPGPGGAVPTGTPGHRSRSRTAPGRSSSRTSRASRATPRVATLQGRGVTNIKVVEQETDDRDARRPRHSTRRRRPAPGSARATG